VQIHQDHQQPNVGDSGQEQDEADSVLATFADDAELPEHAQYQNIGS
jgi:hypothetical protein